MQIETKLFNSLFINYGLALNYLYKSYHQNECISSDGVVTGEENGINYFSNFEYSNLTIGANIEIGYKFKLSEQLEGRLGIESNMPSLIRSKDYTDLTHPFSVGIKIGIDLFYNKKLKYDS